jgi:acetolactate synthase-1/2/3 large subunit
MLLEVPIGSVIPMSHPANPEGCSNVIVQVLKLNCVTHVVDVLGAKIDSLFVALNYSSINPV